MCDWFVGRTALHWAAAVNNEEAAHALICFHANVDAQDEHNQTPLFLAAREGSYQVAQILLQLGKANADLPDHMERFPRDVALERQHRDIAQLIEEFSRGPITTMPVAAGGVPSMQVPASKSRSKKSSSQRKQAARSSVNSEVDHEDDGLLWNSRAATENSSTSRPKKSRRPRVTSLPSAGQSVSQMQSAAKLCSILDPAGEMRLFSPEQPPSYENAMNSQRARFAAMQQATGMGTVDAQPAIFHTNVTFEQQQQHQFDPTPEMAYAGMMPTEVVGFHPQPNGVVLRPSLYPPGGLVDADPSHMVHNSPTVPSCQAYSPQNMAAVQVPEVRDGRQVSMMPQRVQLHPSQNPHQHHRHQHHQRQYSHPSHPTPSDAAYISPVSAIYSQPTPSTASMSVGPNIFQYPTPPSNQTTSPPLTQHASGYPTPSPEASPPELLTSLSPNSVNSDWLSERGQNGSPKRAVANQNIKNEPAYV